MTYQYKCTNEDCDVILEINHGMLESPEVRCPECDSVCKRVITGGVGVIYKSKGFYSTDYKKNEVSNDIKKILPD